MRPHSAVCRLRICGSQQTEDFLCAFDYYSLWPLEPNARQLLRTAQIGHKSSEWRANERVLFGTEPPSNSRVPNDTPGPNSFNDDAEINLSEPARVAMEEIKLGTPMTIIASSEEEEIVLDDASTDLSNEGGALDQWSTVCDT